MTVSVHATPTESGTLLVRLVLAPTDDGADPPTPDVLEAVTTAVWSLGYLTHSDGHSLAASNVPRPMVMTVAREMVRVSCVTIGVWREAEVLMPEVYNLPFSVTV